MKHLKTFDIIRENKLSTYTDVWVIIKYGDTDIDGIYLEKDEANSRCVERNEEIKQFDHIKSKYEVKSLDEAIDMIKDCVRGDERENYASNNDESY